MARVGGNTRYPENLYPTPPEFFCFAAAKRKHPCLRTLWPGQASGAWSALALTFEDRKYRWGAHYKFRVHSAATEHSGRADQPLVTAWMCGWGRGQGRELGRSGNHTRLSPSFNVGTTRTQNHSKKELANYKLQIPYPLEILISRSGVGPTYIYLFSR